MSDMETPTRRRSLPHHIATILDGRVQSHHPEYRGVQMRSQLEASFARHLDGLGVDWEYEPRPFTDPTGGGYLPDFRVGRTYFEIKPTIAEVALAQARMEGIWLEERDAILVVVSGEGCLFYAATRGEEWTSWVERWAH